MSTATMNYEAVPPTGVKEVTSAKSATNAARQIFQQLAALLEETKGLPGSGPMPGEVVKEASPAEVTGLLQSVKRVCGGAARGLSKQLGPITAALNSGASIRVSSHPSTPPLHQSLGSIAEALNKLVCGGAARGAVQLAGPHHCCSQFWRQAGWRLSPSLHDNVSA